MQYAPVKSRETKMAIVVADDSFKKPGAVPFTWEARPGVSKFEHHNTHEPTPPISSSLSLSRSSSFNSSPSRELQTQWVQSMNLSSNNKSSFLTRLDMVLGRKNGCFPISWLRWKWGKEKRMATPKLKVRLELDPESMQDYTFYLEKLAQWSMSTSLRSSPPFSPYKQRSSPQLTSSDDEETTRSRVLHSLSKFLRGPKMIGGERKGREKKELSISVYVVNKQE